jgi:plasmid maintenance system antidote protein VapI
MSISEEYGKLLRQTRRSLAYWVQIAKIDFTDDVLRWMEVRQVSRTRLGEILGVSPQFITKVLRTNANLTIETMTKIGLALNCQVRIHLADRNAVTEWRDRPSDITRVVVPLGQNVTFIDRKKFRTIVGGSEKTSSSTSVIAG